MTEKNDFSSLGLSESTLKAIKKKGFEEPTEIQAATIPLLLRGDKDIVGQAQTGTGKTAAFGLPLIEALRGGSQTPHALILAPTRELAVQVAEEISSFKGRKKLTVIPIYGGQSISEQIRKLKRGADIVVGTPGRVIDHINRRTLNLNKLTHMILDEADEMLNMGFVEDIEEILKSTNDDKRMLLFSATMPKPILRIAENYMGDYDIIRIKKKQLTAQKTNQIYFEVNERDRFEALCRIIDIEPEFYGLVFCRTKIDVDRVSQKLADRGYDADGLHGDISQAQRERILKRFKRRFSTVLVATDLAARGIDINDLTHVINYALPQDPESYVHRIGRTGRAGKEGTAITFVTPHEYKRLVFIERIAKTKIKRKNIPKVKDIIEAKKDRISKKIDASIEKDLDENCLSLAADMLGDHDPHTLVAALLQTAYANELTDKSYSKIRDVKTNLDINAKTRLFVAKGRDDGYSPRKLVEMIEKEASVPQSSLQEVRVLEKFSFVTTNFIDAELILNIFKKKAKGRRPIVSKAKDRDNSRQGQGQRRNDFSNRNRRRQGGDFRRRSPRR